EPWDGDHAGRPPRSIHGEGTPRACSSRTIVRAGEEGRVAPTAAGRVQARWLARPRCRARLVLRRVGHSIRDGVPATADGSQRTEQARWPTRGTDLGAEVHQRLVEHVALARWNHSRG